MQNRYLVTLCDPEDISEIEKVILTDDNPREIENAVTYFDKAKRVHYHKIEEDDFLWWVVKDFNQA
jgi:hypothetical protein